MDQHPTDPGDLTARARIRHAALQLFTEQGFAATTIRDIARRAVVSPGLIRHHFGSKEGLRQACDEHAIQAARSYLHLAMSSDGLANPQRVGEAHDAAVPYGRYLARALLDDSSNAAKLFDEMVAMAAAALQEADAQRSRPPLTELRTRAAVMVAMDLGIPTFEHQISRVMGVDAGSPVGIQLMTSAKADVLGQPSQPPDQS